MLYTPDITAKISAEAAKPNSIFSLNDRIGLVIDSVALAKAGFSDTGSMFTLINGLRGEKECRRFYISGSMSFGADSGVRQIWFGTVSLTVSAR